MRTLLLFCTSVLFAVSSAGCSKPASEAVSEPPEASAEAPSNTSLRGPDAGEPGGSDPTVVDPDRYKTEFENDAVRVLRISYGPGEESVMHYHPASVAVFLTGGDVRMTMADGTSTDASVPAGTATFSAGGEHRPMNLSDTAFEVLEIELKAREPGHGESGGPDSSVVDADHYAVEFENDAIRILRISYGPGEESVLHYHPDSVAVFLTDHLVQMTMPDGETDQIEASAGDVMFIPAGQHLPKNISDFRWELVLVELK